MKALKIAIESLLVRLVEREEMWEALDPSISSCAEKVCAVEPSNERQSNTVPDINLRITRAFPNIGKGYSAIEKFCMAVNVSPFSSRTYSKCTKLLHTAYSIAAETLQSEVHSFP
ncbi:hypothetical protein TNCV_801181 [Trichonephila clavipes]|uniref:Uncharacterized protein n=1 Tax=Trichonephila clavipes TaxID=2585209 RepID=A0A8X6R453_TRICX|nr:hypothetical protein TNCV_801181 [Trichonephila clavipes]